MIKRTLSTAVLAGLVLPASSLALGGSADKSCYSHFPQNNVSEPITVSVNGGTPGAGFTVVATNIEGGQIASVPGTFDTAGNGAVALEDLTPVSTKRDRPSNGQPIKLTVTDSGTGASASIGTVRLNALAMSVNDKPKNPRKARTVKVSGTPFAKKTLYGFVTSKNGKQVLGRFKLGKADGCGYVKKKAVVAPTPFAYGNFRLYVNAGKKINRKLALAFAFRIFQY